MISVLLLFVPGNPMPNYRVPKHHTWRSDAPVMDLRSAWKFTELDVGEERRRDGVMAGGLSVGKDRQRCQSRNVLSGLVFALHALCVA